MGKTTVPAATQNQTADPQLITTRPKASRLIINYTYNTNTQTPFLKRLCQ